MSDVLLSFLIYAIPANLIGGTAFLSGRKRAQMEGLEYFAIYGPYVAFVTMSAGYLNHPESLANNATFHTFAVVLQPIGSGVLGGLTLMPRLFIQPAERLKRLKVTAICTLAMMAVYMMSRLMLFAVLGASYE